MRYNPILDLQLTEVLKDEFALPLRLLKLYTVGGFVRAMSDPADRDVVERVFDRPEQARHAAAVCAAWLGASQTFTPPPAPIMGWWRDDARMAA